METVRYFIVCIKPHSTSYLLHYTICTTQFLEREDAKVQQESQRLSESFLAQKSELEGSMRISEERVKIADGKVTALQRELNTIRSDGKNFRRPLTAVFPTQFAWLTVVV